MQSKANMVTYNIMKILWSFFWNGSYIIAFWSHTKYNHKIQAKGSKYQLKTDTHVNQLAADCSFPQGSFNKLPLGGFAILWWELETIL